MGDFGAKFGQEGVDQCKPNSNAIWERYGAVVHKRNLLPFEHNARTSHTDRQTKKTDHGTVTGIPIDEFFSAMSPNNSSYANKNAWAGNLKFDVAGINTLY